MSFLIANINILLGPKLVHDESVLPDCDKVILLLIKILGQLHLLNFLLGQGADSQENQPFQKCVQILAGLRQSEIFGNSTIMVCLRLRIQFCA